MARITFSTENLYTRTEVDDMLGRLLQAYQELKVLQTVDKSGIMPENLSADIIYSTLRVAERVHVDDFGNGKRILKGLEELLIKIFPNYRPDF